MIRRQTIRQRVRAAGILRHVSADGAGFLAGGIGSEVQAGVLDGTGEIKIDHAWLHDRALIFKVEIEDAIHAREGDEKATGWGKRSAGEPGTCATADDGYVALRGQLNDLGNFMRGLRKDNDVWAALFYRAIVFVEEHVFREVQNSVWAENIFELANQNLRHNIKGWAGLPSL
jgi:hypothetical protein